MSSSTIVIPADSIGRLKRRPGSIPKRPEEIDNVFGEIKEEVKIGNGEHKSYSPPSAEVKYASFNKDQVPSSL
ncbi:hypothetical protein ACFX13_038921 [Malus domestica]